MIVRRFFVAVLAATLVVGSCGGDPPPPPAPPAVIVNQDSIDAAARARARDQADVDALFVGGTPRDGRNTSASA
jgi:hypothetical protein